MKQMQLMSSFDTDMVYCDICETHTYVYKWRTMQVYTICSWYRPRFQLCFGETSANSILSQVKYNKVKKQPWSMEICPSEQQIWVSNTVNKPHSPEKDTLKEI